MWLLSTDRAELQYFPSAETVPGGYAILSHTWGADEQSFQDTQALRQRCEVTGENPRDLANSKIRECCVLAERHGYRWLWVDTSCIDKTSSSELSEAISAMYKWYELALVCYVFLQDVPSDRDLDKPDSPFRASRWLSRGWTLQELIAPTNLIFLALDWSIIGHKVELAPLLEKVTGISSQVLTHELRYSEMSVAERMSWASKRRTTRAEDEAYCLMGLFDVDMPAIYGEGSYAFRRLQVEILKQMPDSSLFAWGTCALSDGVTPMELPETYHFFKSSPRTNAYLSSALAHSPKCFVKPFGRTVRYMPFATHPLQHYADVLYRRNFEDGVLAKSGGNPRRLSGSLSEKDLPGFSLTGYGLECRFPIIESDGLVVAVLLCDTGREHLGLLLHPSKNLVQDPSRRAYHTGYGFRIPSGPPVLARLISLGHDFYNLCLNGKVVTAEWRDIVIADSLPLVNKYATPHLCSPLHSIVPAPPFRIPPWLVRKLARVGMDLLPVEVNGAPIEVNSCLVFVSFYDASAEEGIRIVLGTCIQSPNPPKHWAKATAHKPEGWEGGGTPICSHDCAGHHVEDWENGAKDFGDAERTVRLSFSPCKLTPEYTLVLNVEIYGDVYSTAPEQKNDTPLFREDSALQTPPLVNGVPDASVLPSRSLPRPSSTPSVEESESVQIPLYRTLAHCWMISKTAECNHPVLSLLPPPTSSRLISDSTHSTVTCIIWETCHSGSIIHEWSAHGYSDAQSLMLSQNSRYLAPAATSDEVVLRDLTGASRTIAVLEPWGNVGGVRGWAQSPCGGAIFSGDYRPAMRVWDAHTFHTLCRIELGHYSPSQLSHIVWTYAFSLHGRLWDVLSCTPYDFLQENHQIRDRKPERHLHGTTNLRFNLQGTLLIVDLDQAFASQSRDCRVDDGCRILAGWGAGDHYEVGPSHNEASTCLHVSRPLLAEGQEASILAVHFPP